MAREARAGSSGETAVKLRFAERASALGLRQVADQMFSRASGARLREGNGIRLLRTADENYPAWLEAIKAARHTIHVEMYIIHEDDQGARFADALIAKGREGVRVRLRLLYDWMGGWGNTSRGFWTRLRDGGVEVRGPAVADVEDALAEAWAVTGAAGLRVRRGRTRRLASRGAARSRGRPAPRTLACTGARCPGRRAMIAAISPRWLRSISAEF